MSIEETARRRFLYLSLLLFSQAWVFLLFNLDFIWYKNDQMLCQLSLVFEYSLSLITSIGAIIYLAIFHKGLKPTHFIAIGLILLSSLAVAIQLGPWSTQHADGCKSYDFAFSFPGLITRKTFPVPVDEKIASTEYIPCAYEEKVEYRFDTDFLIRFLVFFYSVCALIKAMDKEMLQKDSERISVFASWSLAFASFMLFNPLYPIWGYKTTVIDGFDDRGAIVYKDYHPSNFLSFFHSQGFAKDEQLFSLLYIIFMAIAFAIATVAVILYLWDKDKTRKYSTIPTMLSLAFTIIDMVFLLRAGYFINFFACVNAMILGLALGFFLLRTSSISIQFYGWLKQKKP